MKRGQTKVMVNAKGIPRIQEETGDTVKVYSLDEWNKELAKRQVKVKEEKLKLPDLETEEEEEIATAEEPKIEPKKLNKTVKKFGKK